MMNIGAFFQKKQTELWRLSGKCAQRDHMFACIVKGNISEVELAVPPYIFHLQEMFEGDFEYAIAAIQYLWVQLASILHNNGGLTSTETYRIQEPYYLKLETVKTIEEALQLYAEQIMEFAYIIANKKQEKRYSELVRRAISYIKDNIYEDISVADVTEAMHFSRSYLSHKFKDETGMTLEAYIRKEKVAEAKLLLESNIPLSTIAQMLGFSSQSHFTQVFKKETGITPRQLRELNRT